MTTQNGTALSTTSSNLVTHKTHMYTDKGLRKIYRGGNAWDFESDDDFLNRFTAGEDVSIMDLWQCCRLHPIVKAYALEGKDYEAVITGVLEGVPYRTIFKEHGFISWGTFREMTEFLCPGLKSLFVQTCKLREDFRLERAEDALRKRAIDGVKEEVYTQSGKLAGYRTRYSDKLLEVHLKAMDPDKYAERQNHKVSGMVLSVNLGLRDSLSDEPKSVPEVIDV